MRSLDALAKKRIAAPAKQLMTLSGNLLADCEWDGEKLETVRGEHGRLLSLESD